MKQIPLILTRLLVVTFTKAAASEMKERIKGAVTEEPKNPDSVNLKRQAVLLNHADIMTIHSFCLSVARENYNRLGIDPAFRVADENGNSSYKGGNIKTYCLRKNTVPTNPRTFI